MVRACLPDLPVEEERLLLGADPAECAAEPGLEGAAREMVAQGLAGRFVA